MITKPKLLLITGIAITIVAFGLGVWAATITAPTSIKIIQCMREREEPKSNIYRARYTRPFRRMCFTVSIRSYCRTCTWYKQLVILGWYNNSDNSYNIDHTQLVS